MLKKKWCVLRQGTKFICLFLEECSDVLPGLEIIYFLKYVLESALWSYSQLASEKDMDLELVQCNLIILYKKATANHYGPSQY